MIGSFERGASARPEIAGPQNLGRSARARRTAKLLRTAGLSGLLVLGLAACDPNKQTLGAGVGALGGAAIGAGLSDSPAAIIAGGVLGALVGSEIGRTMDENDRLRAAQTAQSALETYPSGETAEWENPDSGYSGTVTPSPAFRNDRGQYCREYEQTIRVDGRVERAVGVACREPDGTWRVIQG